MRKAEKIQILKNVGSTWFSLGTNIVVGVFISPFILHRLGDAAFGIWTLIFSITGYYGIFDLGIRSSVVRYVSKFFAVNDRENLSKVLSTSLFSYSCIGLAALLVTAILATFVDSIFRIPPAFHSTAQWLFLMVGSSVALGFPLGVFGGVLEGLQQFYVNNWTTVCVTLMRAALIILALTRGGGLLTVAFITVSLPLLASLVRGWVAMSILRVPLGFGYVNRETVRLIANYSGVTFIILVAGKLRFQTDEVVIGTLLSTVAITHFSIGARIVDYASEVVTGLAQIFIPMASQSDATGNTDRLRKILIGGNRACAFIIFPICVVLILLGRSIIEVWVGARYVAASYPVLVILIIPFTLMLAQATSGRILFGMGRHQTLAMVTMAEGIANVILSVLLVRPYGVVGDALGTAIPLTLTVVLFMPTHLCRLLNVRMWTFLRHTYALPLVVSTPLVLTLLVMRHQFVAHRLPQLAAQLAIGGLVYAGCFYWALRRSGALHVSDLVFKETLAAQ
jgi:O-antigen/teichoic acid export membrane protein